MLVVSRGMVTGNTHLLSRHQSWLCQLASLPLTHPPGHGARIIVGAGATLHPTLMNNGQTT